ncbi:MAG: peptide chain release factor N(5)-glutamine methyltransferase [Dehalococcoidia bacterium]|nr:peptide chain release factor N(5)-glutamine methyltransferase [Dehalococcoidia bacterium]
MRTFENPQTLQQSLAAIRTVLRDGGVVEWQVEAEVLLRHVLGLDRSEFLAEVYGGSGGLNVDQSVAMRSLVDRRLSGEPLAYIVGQREFYGLTLKVDRRVLIPRQETELLVDIVLEHLASSRLRDPIVVDVGTGSGSVALAVAKHAPSARVLATDVSDGALEASRRNAENLGLSDRVRFVHGDMLQPINGPVDVIVSNPPYIPSGNILELAVEVQREPRVALDGGDDGMDPLRRLLNQSAARLAPGGMVVIELMPEQMTEARALAVQTIGCNVDVDTRKDLMGNERALVVKRLVTGVEGPDAGT